jgi:hypothetical protein
MAKKRKKQKKNRNTPILPPRSPSLFHRVMSSIPKLVWLFLAVGTATGYTVFRENINIEPYFSQDDRFAFSTRFKIQNNEIFEAHNVDFTCQIGGNRISGAGGLEGIPTFDAGSWVERDCSINGPLRVAPGTRITWCVTYRPGWLFWRRPAFQSFKASYDVNGKTHWSGEQTTEADKQEFEQGLRKRAEDERRMKDLQRVIDSKRP